MWRSAHGGSKGIIQKLMRIPGVYKKCRAFFAKQTPKLFGEAAGFAATEIQVTGGIWRIDMTRCPYHDACVQYGCPELCPSFCDSDDITYDGMHPKLYWHRKRPWAAETTAATSASRSPGDKKLFWDKVAWIYDVFANAINRKANKALCTAVAELIRPTDEVLECACGTGLLTGVIAPRCRTLTATDFSKEMLKRAERKYGKYPNIKFEQADITRLRLSRREL